MDRKSRISFGPGAASLILIVVILSMSVLGILSLMSARSDARLSDRASQVVAAGYALSESAERALAELDETVLASRDQAADDEDYASRVMESLPEGMEMEERVISWTETDGTRELDCAVELAPLGSRQRLIWVKHSLTAVAEEAWN
ncbi:MAG: hypothetical protein IJH78_05355 [Clostridia bacterium]|nr:hypothetical protein [Clostridia bacterium]